MPLSESLQLTIISVTPCYSQIYFLALSLATDA